MVPRRERSGRRPDLPPQQRQLVEGAPTVGILPHPPPCSNSSSDIGSEVGTERKAVDAGTGVAAGGKRGRRDRDGRQRGWLWPPGPEWSPTGELSWLERETSRQYEEHN